MTHRESILACLEQRYIQLCDDRLDAPTRLHLVFGADMANGAHYLDDQTHIPLRCLVGLARLGPGGDDQGLALVGQVLPDLLGDEGMKGCSRRRVRSST